MHRRMSPTVWHGVAKLTVGCISADCRLQIPYFPYKTDKESESMIKSTLSFHMGASFNLMHDNRTIWVNADAEYEREHNWYYEGNTTLEDCYESLFGDPFREYNATVRESRRYHSYLEKLQNAEQKEKDLIAEKRLQGLPTSQIRKFQKATKPAYEILIAFGNSRDNPEFRKGGNMQETAKEIMIRYTREFERNNPNVKIVNASVHTGEQGVVHLGLVVVFHADCSRGQKHQASLNRALAQMGYESDKAENADGKRLNAVTKWENRQREILRDMCREKGIEIIDGKCSRTHLETAEFKAKADADFVDRMAGELLREQDRFKEYVIGSDSAVSYLEHIENEKLRKTVSKQDEILSACWDEFSEQNQSYFDYYRKQKKRISDEVGRLRNETNDSRQYLNELLCDLVFSNDLLIVRLWKLFFAILVAAEARTAEYRLKQLEDANREIAKQSKHIMASSKTVGTALRNKDDLDAVLASLNCFEREVSRSVEEINNIMCNRARIERESER